MTFLWPILELLFFRKYWGQKHSPARTKVNELQVNLNLNHTLYPKHIPILHTMYLPTLRVCPGVSKFFIRSLSLPVRAPNLPEIPTTAFFRIFSLILLLLRCQKGKWNKKWILSSYLSCSWFENVKQSNQIDVYLTSIVIAQKLTNQIAQYLVESWHGFRTLLLMLWTLGSPSGDFQRVSDIVEDF